MISGRVGDRRVHAWYDGMHVVRYERAGKWYLEPLNKTLPRQQVTVAEAARMAIWGRAFARGAIKFGIPGGSTFDRLVKNG